MYFGSKIENTTFVLGREEESEQLQVVREDEGFNFWREPFNTASRGFTKEIYAFDSGTFTQVHQYSLESGEWTLYYVR